jgi:pimeloyl-ACP methyl ester carboxylesterase
MYHARPWKKFPAECFINWPDYRGEESIAGIATRVVEENSIGDGAILIGSSLGGIVACEISGQVALRDLILIGSAVSPREISRLLALLHPLAQLAPVEFIQRATGKIPGELARMFTSSDAGFIRAMCCAIFDWRGLDFSRTEPLRIHGAKDCVIPIPPKVDLTINGGHLVAMTHPEECVGFIETHLAQRAGPGME